MVLEIRGISKSYGEVQALKNVSLNVGREIFFILGPSGSGKTTLIRIIAGLEIPDSGEILMNRKIISGSKFLEPWKRNIAMVFQDLALWSHMTVRKHLEFVLKHKNVPREKWDSKISETLSLLRIENLEFRKPDELSGGEKQRLALARSLIQNPNILLLDEPLANLDMVLKKEILAHLEEIHKKFKIPIIYVTHDLQELKISDRLAFIYKGEVLQQGKLKEFLKRPENDLIKEYFSEILTLV